MKITSTSKELDVAVVTYPCLRLNLISGYVVLFTDPCKGMIVDIVTQEHNVHDYGTTLKVGHISVDWSHSEESVWAPYNKEVIVTFTP